MTHRGLTHVEAADRLRTEGPNALPSDGPAHWITTLVGVVKQPMLALLILASLLYLALGDRVEAVTLLVSVGFVISLDLFQERKTVNALAALRDLASPRALVVREGESLRIAGTEVVRGDIVLIDEGDRVPADARVLEATGLLADESLLTGESVPVRKRAMTGDEPACRPGGDDLPFLFSGTLVVKGHGTAEVTATGARSELGRIGRALATTEPSESPLEQEVKTLVRTVALFALGASILLGVVYGLREGDVIEGLLAGVALAMSLLPEEMPLVLTVFLAIGALRMSRRGVLARRMTAVEALGATTVLCTDKTGTLTENRMRIAALHAHGVVHEVGGAPMPEAVHDVVEYGVLASQPHALDPMELAFHRLADSELRGTEHLHAGFVLVREYPLSRELLALAHVWRSPEGGALVVAAKGAPEAIVDLCHLPASEAAAVLADASAFARRGLRVLGVARAIAEAPALPELQHDFDFRFVGLVALEDPLRATVQPAVAACREAGIRVVLITGDYPETAIAIARKAGFARPDAVMTGTELVALDDAALMRRMNDVDVVARAVPEQKLRIVQALRASGEVVAMTGDGVNDAPALEAAHIGVAMGGRGTDVAREAADLVITDDDFASIVTGVRLGRRIFDNLRKATAYILAVHAPIAALALVPALAGLPLVLLPIHIVFLELVIDPACSLAFEASPEEPDVMTRPPRGLAARLVDRRVLLLALLQGACVTVAVLLVLFVAHWAGSSEGSVRLLAFVALIGGNLALIFVNRSWSSHGAWATNRAALAVTVVTLVTLVIVVAVPALRSLFGFELEGAAPLLGALTFGAFSVGWFEPYKRRGAILGRPRGV